MSPMKILIIGNGGREHALAWHIAKSPLVQQIYVAPGNGGTAFESKTQNVTIPPTAIDELLNFAKQNKINLTIVGPEAPLAAGIVDKFEKANLHCFGPTQKAAQLESSKAFSKAFMKRHNIPTANYVSFTDAAKAISYIKQCKFPIVIKVDGLAAGKGVVIAQSPTEAQTAIENMLVKKIHGQTNAAIVIEEYLHGEEASFIAMVDGDFILPLATSQDHKTRDNGDHGPNTGGMGAYSPAPVITAKLQQRILKEIMQPTVNGMKKEGHPYRGFLYAGLMISAEGKPFVLEFNCRLGDPEAEPILMRLQSSLVDACFAALDQQLAKIKLSWDKRAALGVVLTARGYPAEYPTGEIIFDLPVTLPANCKIFHAGTRFDKNNFITTGGRVLCVTALGDTISEAQIQAYQIAKQIHWEHMHYRTDIGYRAIAKELVKE